MTAIPGSNILSHQDLWEAMILLEPAAQLGHSATNKAQALNSGPCAVIELSTFCKLVNIPELWLPYWEASG